MLQQVLMQELPPAFVLPGVAEKAHEEKPADTQQGAAQALFDLLLLEFLRPAKEKETPRVRTTPKATPAVESSMGQPPGWKSWIPQSYFSKDQQRNYRAVPEQTTVDYGKLFDYLGKLKTAGGMYQDHYHEGDSNRRFHNDGESLSQRIVERELRREFFAVSGLNSLDYTNPFEREQYEMHMKLVDKTLRMVRQMFAAS